MSRSLARRVLVNGLSAGTGGGLTVAREVAAHLGSVRPDWSIWLYAIEGHPLHQELRGVAWPANVELVWAPAAVRGRWARDRFERRELAAWCQSHGVDVAINLNGMLIRGFPVKTLCHFQDPWPYRSEAWGGLQDRVVAWLKRRRHRISLRKAWCCGWTSQYLRDLICSHHGIRPANGHVFYNGIPTDWLQRASAQQVEPWAARPLEICTVSNVFPYKRQDLVIRAVAALRREPSLNSLTYRIIGACQPGYQRELEQLIANLGLQQAVFVEGRVPDARVQSVLSRSRGMCLMSVCESFGIPAIEAMSYGTPVVVARSCALPEVCGDAAAYCAEDQLEELVSVLRQVLCDEGQATALQRRGFARVQEFGWSRTAEQMARVIEGEAP